MFEQTIKNIDDILYRIKTLKAILRNKQKALRK